MLFEVEDTAMDEAPLDDANGPCAGFRVLEFGTMVSGPLAGQTLGDLGADVIKIETLMGDTARWTGPPERDGINGFFSQFNRNKRAISVDMKSKEGIEIVRKLALSADVIICNYRPGVAERLGFGYESLCKENPGLIFVSVTGFGPDGPYADQPVYDLVVQGMSGTMPAQGDSGPPQMIRSVIADKNAAITASSAALAALLARERNGGEGQHVHVPMINAYAQLTLPDMMSGEAFRPKEKAAPFLPNIFHVWTCADGYLVGMPIEDKQYANLCKALGREDLASDERFVGLGERLKNIDEMIALIDAEFRDRPWREALAALHENDVPFAPVYDLASFMEDPQVKHNRTVFDAEDPRGGTTRFVRHPGIYEKTPATLRRHPPRYGEHTEEILAEAGYNEKEIAALRTTQAVA
jgi:crotonobetainyl-CoA:carnitine CoA-transferase CaiB-like acyl-CoA transferase